MKKLLFLLCLPSLCIAQQKSDSTNLRLDKAGIEMQRFAAASNTGTAFQLTGALFCVGSIINNNVRAKSPNYINAKPDNTILYLGAGLALIGTIISVSARSHMTKAGIILGNNQVVIPLSKHTKTINP